MRNCLFILLLLLQTNVFAQSPEDDFEEFLDYDAYESIYEVKTNDKGLSGLVRISDNKLMIPYIFSQISTDGTPSPIEPEYFVVYDTLNKAGLYSLKDKKTVVACKYDYIELRYEDFYPFDDNNIEIFCGITGEVFKDNESTLDFYSPKWNKLLTINGDVELSFVSNDSIVCIASNKNFETESFALYNIKTGVVKSQKKGNILNYQTPLFIIKEDKGVGLFNASSNSYFIKPACDSIKFDFSDIYVYRNGATEVFVDGKPLYPKGLYNDVSGSWFSQKLDKTIWCVNKNGKWGAADEENNIIIPIDYDYAFNHSFFESMVDSTWVSKDRKWGLINHKGETVVPFQYDTIILDNYESHSDNNGTYFDYYRVKKDNKWSCLKKDGTVLVSVESEKPFQYADSMFVVKNNMWQWIDRNNKELLKLNLDASVYDDLKYSKNSIVCKHGNTSINIDTKGNIAGILLDNGEVLTSICEAINKGNIAGIKQFVGIGIDLNNKYKYHEKTAWAEFDSEKQPVAMLLSSTNTEIKNNMADLFDMFIKNGLKLDLQEMEFSVIQYIVRSEISADEIMKMLRLYVDNKGDINIQGRYKYTALREIIQTMYVFHTFKCEDAIRLCRFLFENGADPNLKCMDGDTPLKIAKQTGCDELVTLIKEYSK